MKSKWYIIALIFALAIVGISLKQTSVPNQEIVLQFTDVEVSASETKDAISSVKSQLEAVAVDNIKIQELRNGTLKITYYSDIDVSEIKKIFSSQNAIAFDYTSYGSEKGDTKLPSEKELTSYQLDVYEIQDSNDSVGSSGHVVEAKSESIRFFIPDTYASIHKQRSEVKNKIEKLAYTVHRNIALVIDNAEYNIPEVRAGPTA